MSHFIPPSAEPDVREAFRQVWLAIDRIIGTRNTDFHGRRIINAGWAVDDADYVVLAQVRELIQLAAVGAVEGSIDTGSGIPLGAVVFGGSGGSLSYNEQRFTWDDTTFQLRIEGDIIEATWAGEIIAVDFGGTGLGSGTSGGVLAFTAPTVLSSSGLLASGEVVVGGGAGVVPSTTGWTVQKLLEGGKWLSADPVSPADGDYWVTVSGVSPARVAALKARDSGITRTIASITY